MEKKLLLKERLKERLSHGELKLSQVLDILKLVDSGVWVEGDNEPSIEEIKCTCSKTIGISIEEFETLILELNDND